jgi:hypothetical protein
MGELSTVMDVADKSINFMPLEGTSFDRAVAANFEETLQNVLTYDDFAHYIGTFLRFDLPCTFGVLLNSSNSEHMDEMVSRAVELLFANNKLSEGYVEVCRRVMGDERFLGICKNEYEKTVSSGSPLKTGSLRSVAYLSAIFGEETFHSTKFFEGIFAQDGEGHVPRHVRQFSIIGFDDLDLPVLRGLIVSNLERLVFFKPSYTNELEITLNLCRLAHQQGAGEVALRLLLKRVGEVAGGETHADQASVVIDGLVSASVPSVGSRGNALLKHVVELVGLNTLKEVVPDVGTALLSEFIDEKKPALTEVEIIHLFPQMKANLLESSLGL